MYKAPCTVGWGLEFWVLIRPVLLGGGGWAFRVTAWCPLRLQRSGLLPPRRDDRSSSLLGLSNITLASKQVSIKPGQSGSPISPFRFYCYVQAWGPVFLVCGIWQFYSDYCLKLFSYQSAPFLILLTMEHRLWLGLFCFSAPILFPSCYLLHFQE